MSHPEAGWEVSHERWQEAARGLTFSSPDDGWWVLSGTLFSAGLRGVAAHCRPLPGRERRNILRGCGKWSQISHLWEDKEAFRMLAVFHSRNGRQDGDSIFFCIFFFWIHVYVLNSDSFPQSLCILLIHGDVLSLQWTESTSCVCISKA